MFTKRTYALALFLTELKKCVGIIALVAQSQRGKVFIIDVVLVAGRHC